MLHSHFTSLIVVHSCAASLTKFWLLIFQSTDNIPTALAGIVCHFLTKFFVFSNAFPPPVSHGFGFDRRHQRCCESYCEIALRVQILIYNLCYIGHSKRIRVNQSYFCHLYLLLFYFPL